MARRRPPNVVFHDRFAGRYDATYEDDPYWRWWRDLVWRRARRVLPDPPAPVLDAGAGTGHFGLRAARAGWKVTLSDLSPKMCEAARRKALDLPESRRPEVVEADLATLTPFADAGFAAVLAIGDVLSFVPDAATALRSVRRVLRPGGVLVATVDNVYGAMEHFVTARDVTALERFLKDGKTEWLAHREEERFPSRAFTPEGLGELLAGAGFTVEKMAAQTALPMRAHREWLESGETSRRLAAIEERLASRPACLGRGAHLFVVARRGSPGATSETAASA